MIYREYTDEDYDQVRDLIAADFDFVPKKDELGGYAVVAEDEGKVIAGFVWALTSETSSITYIDYFVVKKCYRDKKEVGPQLMTRMFSDLIRMGKNISFGVIIDGAEYAESLAKIYNYVGMKLVPAKYRVVGETYTILDGINRRYNNG